MIRSARIFLTTALLCAVISACADPETGNDKQAKLIVTPDQSVMLVEGGDPAVFAFAASTYPSADLTLRVIANDPARVSVDIARETGRFFPNASTIEVSCIDDHVADGPHDVALMFKVSSSDPSFDGKSELRFITCLDSENTDVFDPNDDFCPDDPNKTSPGICGCGIADTPENTAPTATGYARCLVIQAAQAAIDNEGEPYALDILLPDGYTLSEDGGEEIFGVALTAEPASEVRVAVTSDDATEGVPSVSELVFTPENWNDPQLVIVTAVDDDEIDGNVPFAIHLGPAQTEDPNYADLAERTITFETLDNEAPDADIIFSTREVSVHEGGTSGELYLQLAKAPESDTDEVTVRFESDDPSEARVFPQELIFNAGNWDTPQVALVKAYTDDAVDGNKSVAIRVASTSTEACTGRCYNDRDYDPVIVNVIDTDTPAESASTETVHLRIMAGNITSGNAQSYDPGHGARIFKGLKPDIVLIQEFNYKKGSISDFVKDTFGDEFSYARGEGKIPNGIISRYPITSSGSWTSNMVSDRKWDWAVIDIPGDRDLLAVSVHLYTSGNTQEMGPLRAQIDKKIAKDNRDYYVVMGGDFNQVNWSPIRSNFGSLFTVGKNASDFPIDQNGKYTTNAKRVKQYDYLLCSTDFCKFETPTVIGSRSYPKGHVVDTRVYSKADLAAIAPAQAKDSGATNMQHMAVVRDFEYKVSSK